MILDVNDPSGLGVFSKTGRQLTEKIPMLAKRKIHHQQTFDLHTHNMDITQPLQPNRSLSSKPEPFTVSLSREKREGASRERLNYPVVGQYRYEVNERPQLIMDYLEAYRKAQRNQEGVAQRRRRLAKPDIQVPYSESFEATQNNKSVGHIDMSKMIGRQESFRAAFKMPSEMPSTENPQDLGMDSKMEADERERTRKKGIILFEKQLSRQKVYPKLEASPLCYDCNFQYTRKPLGKVGAPFNTLTKRRDVIHPTYTSSAAKYDYDEYVWRGQSSVYPKTRTGNILFNRQTNRYRQRATD